MLLQTEVRIELPRTAFLKSDIVPGISQSGVEARGRRGNRQLRICGIL